MSELKLFTKDDCGKCEHVKERMPEGLDVQIINASTVDGLALAAYYEIVEKDFPVLVVDDEAVCGAINILDRLKSIAGKK